MADGYVIDSTITEGLGDILAQYVNEEIDAINEDTEEYEITHFGHDKIYNEYITLEDLMVTSDPFPALCYFLVESSSEIRTVSLEMARHTFLLAIFIEGENGRERLMRYKAAVQKAIEEHDTEVYTCVLRGRVSRARYYQPLMYESTAYRVAELIVDFNTEVRK
jgi:hypothetical protein